MSSFAAIVTSDAALVCCELHRARPLVRLGGPGLAAGLGAFQDDVVLQRHYGAGQTADLWEPPPSPVVLLHAGALPADVAPQHDVQPFRFRHWLFAQAGGVERPEAVRDRLHDELPEYLQSAVRGSTLDEVVFARFLSELRALGRMQDPSLEPRVGAALLQKAAQAVEHASAEVGGREKASLALVATNGRVLLGARRGAQTLVWRLLEGQRECARCGLGPDASDAESAVRDHLRRRSVVLATAPVGAEGWVPVPDGAAVSVDRRLDVRVA